MRVKTFEYIKNYLWGAELTAYSNAHLTQECLIVDAAIKNKNSKLIKNRDYNLFSYPGVHLNKLYFNLVHAIKPKLKTDCKYMIHADLNIVTNAKFSNWKKPWPENYEVFTGFVCVEVMSLNHSMVYKLLTDEKTEYTIPLKNELVVFGKSSNDVHKPTDWISNNYRITIPFTILPVTTLQMIYTGNTPDNFMKKYPINHYIPFA